MGDFVKLGKRTTRLSAALFLKDDFSGDAVTAAVGFLVNGSKRTPVLNPSGYFLFLDLPEGQYEVTVKAEGFRDSVVAFQPAEDRGVEIITLNLIPLPSYRFPSGTTLLRGTAFENDGKTRIGGATVELKLRGEIKTAVTTDNGEYVIYVFPLKKETNKKINGKYFLLGPSDTIDLLPTFSKEGFVDGNTDLQLVIEGNKLQVNSICMETGKTTIVNKCLEKGGD